MRRVWVCWDRCEIGAFYIQTMLKVDRPRGTTRQVGAEINRTSVRRLVDIDIRFFLAPASAAGGVRARTLITGRLVAPVHVSKADGDDDLCALGLRATDHEHVPDPFSPLSGLG